MRKIGDNTIYHLMVVGVFQMGGEESPSWKGN